jgi:L-fuconolactonase
MTGPKTALLRRFMAEDLRPTLVENGVDKTILVQTRLPMNETREFLDLVPSVDFLAGIIGWVDLASSGVGEDIQTLRRHPSGRFLVGVRHKLHDEPDPAWILRPEVQRGIAAVQDAGLVFDFLVRPRELPACLETARRSPGLRFVIEHIAKPDIAGREISHWSARMAPFADLPNVACKLSGMVTEADPARWTASDLAPYVARVLEWFGEDRLLFGSDWPVCLLAGSYGQVKAALDTALGDIGLAARAKIFGANAIAIYRLPSC